jgi:pimeloyl-ACP methyl ester carboxylesterase
MKSSYRVTITGKSKNCRRATERPVIVFVAGWGSTPFTWRFFIPELSRDFEVHYFETREKLEHRDSKSILSDGLHAKAMAEDILDYLDSLNETHVILSSSSAIYFSKICHKLKKTPRSVSYLSPLLYFPDPKLTRLGPILIAVSKLPMAASALKRMASFIWRNAESERLQGIYKIIDNGSLQTLYNSARQLRNEYADLANLSILQAPSLIVSAAEDSLHKRQEVEELQSHLFNADSQSVATFGLVHSSRAARIVADFIRRSISSS